AEQRGGRAGRLVLALRRRRVGGGVHGGVCGRPVGRAFQPDPDVGLESPTYSEVAMASEPHERDALEMPRPTVAPLLLAAGVSLLGAGIVFGLALTVVG